MLDEIFSEQERDVIKILGSRRMTITQIANRFYAKEDIFEANNNIARIVRRINTKCEFHKLDWFLNGEGGGRAGRLLWKEKQ